MNGSSLYTQLGTSFRQSDFFSPENVALIGQICLNTLAKEFKQKVMPTRSSIAREMQSVYEERVESIPEMNRRVVIILCRLIRNGLLETERNNYLLDNYWEASTYCPSMGMKPFDTPKLNNRIRQYRFHFT